MNAQWSPRQPQSEIRKDGTEAFRFSSIDAAVTIRDYWIWANSDLLDNTARGTLAEFMVSYALNQTHELHRNWGAFDVRSDNGLKVEVKSASYAQSWPQTEPSKVGFDIAPRSQAWDQETDEVHTLKTPQRAADVYVFCLLGSPEEPFPDPMDFDQWAFFVLATETLNRDYPTQKRLTLSHIEEIADRENRKAETAYGKLKGVIEDVPPLVRGAP